jgi:hypothetical protein
MIITIITKRLIPIKDYNGMILSERRDLITSTLKISFNEQL